MTIPSPAERADYIDAAADLLERNGWKRGGYGMCGSAHCAEGALAEVTGSHIQGDALMRPTPLHVWVREDLIRAFGDPIYTWNDRHHKPESVIRKLRKAATELRATA